MPCPYQAAQSFCLDKITFDRGPQDSARDAIKHTASYHLSSIYTD